MAVPPSNEEQYRWSNESDNPLSTLSRQAVLSELQLALACTPNPEDDVENHASRISIRLGCGKGRALMLSDVGLFLKRMPRIAELVVKRGCFSLAHVSAMATSTIAVAEDKFEHVESDILSYLHPRRDLQAIPGLRTFKRTLCEIVDKHDSMGVNDEENPKDHKASEYVKCEPSLDGNFGEISAQLRKDRAGEFMSILTSIRLTEIQAGRTCTWGDALMHLARGSASTQVVMNVYSPLPQIFACSASQHSGQHCGQHNGQDTGPHVGQHPHQDSLPTTSPLTALTSLSLTSPSATLPTPSPDVLPEMWLEGAGWLDQVATAEWLQRLSSIRLSSDSTVGGYTPSQSQIARVRGRDGTCRFPGCDVPATLCDIDHIKPYDRENPADSGPTSTDNLHCLCRRHHNLKTHHFWEITSHSDHSETWSSCDGKITARSVPTGPLAGFGRQTFNQRLTRKSQTIRKLNVLNDRLQAEAQELVTTARLKRPDITLENLKETDAYLNALSEFRANEAEFARAVSDGWQPLEQPEPEPPF